ncbi:MAG: hypothetical protein O6848_00925 [Bacteroidetes bacterium]|nr:hypothetical protein [Bacteroidota bacterium]
MQYISSLLYKALLTMVLVLIINPNLTAQCAMCRSTLENNVSNGDVGIAANLNFGILYLFLTPYLLVSIIAFFWYKSSRAKLHQKESISRKLKQLLLGRHS